MAGPAIGAAVFVLWIGLNRLMGTPVTAGIPPALAASSAGAGHVDHVSCAGRYNHRPDR